MYILKNALVSITRNKGRNLLIGIIVIVIACTTTITLATKSAATNLIESYENKYDITATIGINRESMRNEMRMDKEMTEEDREEQKNNMKDKFSEANNLTISDIEKYGDSEYVKEYYYTLSIGVNANNLEKASMDFGEEKENQEFGNTTNTRGGKENFQNMTSSDFTLMGYSSLSSMEDFISGKYSITDGKLEENRKAKTCVINAELASINDLKVGDEITFVDPDNESNTITLEITGIFEETSSTEEAMGMFTTSANTIITNVDAITPLTENDEELRKSLTPTFVLTDKDKIEKFQKEVTEKGLSEYLTVSTNLDQVENATSTIANVNTFATTFLVITLIIGGIVLFVINMINIRERKYEIGVLRTIGMKKSYVALQFMAELLIVSLIALTLGGAIGAISSVPVSNHLLENEIAASNAEKENVNKNFGGKMEMNGREMNKMNGFSNVQAFDKIDAAVDLKVLIQLFGIGILLTLISSLASIISIEKFSPLTILKERS